MVEIDPPRVVLASGSRFRRRMLEQAGLAVAVDPADIDEAALRRAMTENNHAVDPAGVAAALALAKAVAVSARQPHALVIGSDQILACEGEIFAKPADPAEARRHIGRLAGRTHRLHTAAVLVCDGTILWSRTETALMTMRTLDDAAIDRYLAAAGAGICDTVGAYEFEGRGAQLFSHVDGDQFTIVGLPLLALLEALRAHGVQLP